MAHHWAVPSGSSRVAVVSGSPCRKLGDLVCFAEGWELPLNESFRTSLGGIHLLHMSCCVSHSHCMVSVRRGTKNGVPGMGTIRTYLVEG